MQTQPNRVSLMRQAVQGFVVSFAATISSFVSERPLHCKTSLKKPELRIAGTWAPLELTAIDVIVSMKMRHASRRSWRR